MGGLFGLFNRAGGSSSAGTESPTTSTSGSTTSTSLTAQATPTLPTSGANDTVHAPLAPNPTLTTSPSNTPSPSDQNQKLLTSAFTSTGKSSESPTTSSPTALPASSDHRLTNGTVAGVVIAVAVGFALVTSLATFFITRRRKGFEGKDRHTKSEESSASESKSVRQQEQASKPKVPFMTPTASASAAFDDYIPQPADDATVKHNVNTIMDQIELHVENFYQNSSATPSTRNNAELALFDSPYLAASLASLLPRSKTKTHLIKHALAQHITSSISPTSSHAKSLLPQEFVLLPDAVRSAKTGAKPGSAQLLSQWRVLTSYLRPDPSKDAAYLAERDQRIQNTVSAFSKAFAPWKKPGYSDADRSRSLLATIEGAADLGVWMFAQPSTFEFRWPKHSEADRGRLAVLPALVKTTDERGQGLREAQVVVNMVMKI